MPKEVRKQLRNLVLMEEAKPDHPIYKTGFMMLRPVQHQTNTPTSRREATPEEEEPEDGSGA